MAETRPKWPQALDPSFRAIHDEAEAKFNSKLDKIFHVQKSDSAFEKDTSLSGYSQLEETPELGAIKYEDAAPGWEVTYTHKKFAKGAAISQEMIDDNKWNMVRRTPKALALSKMRTLETAGADVFNYGFVAGGGGKANFTGGDSQALFSANHVNRAGDIVQSNRTTAPLTQVNLQTVVAAMKKRLDSKGQIIEYQPSILLVPSELEFTARIILETVQQTGTGNNDINPIKGALELVVWPYLKSSTAWFVLDGDAHELNFFIRKDEGVQGPKWDFDNEAAKWKSVVRFSVGFSSWEGVYGSVGDGS